jgi:hypothetical protein
MLFHFICVVDIKAEIGILVYGLCCLSNISADFRLSNNVSRIIFIIYELTTSYQNRQWDLFPSEIYL